MAQNIYLDNNATTKIAPEVLEEMVKYSHLALNPSSIHQLGRKANMLLEGARSRTSQLLGCPSSHLFFTSGATEAVTTLLTSFAKRKKARILSSKVEHSCIYETVMDLEKKGVDVVYLPVSRVGKLDMHSLKTQLLSSFPGDTLVVLGSVNAETGAFLDLKKVATLCKEHSAFFLVDAVAHIGKKPFKIEEGISAACFSAHKFHGPKGIGCFYAAPEFSVSPLLLGGGQEQNKRAGTENLEGALGLAKALEIACLDLEKNENIMRTLRDYFEDSLRKEGVQFRVNGPRERICNLSNLCFPNVPADALFIQLDLHGIFASTGPACLSRTALPSRVLLETVGREDALCSVRFSFSKQNTKEEVRFVSSFLKKTLPSLTKGAF